VCARLLLDLSAASDAVDHWILLTVLKDKVSVQKGALDWFSSYLTGCNQCVSASSGRSEPTELTCGIPQGFVPGLAKFIAYTEDLRITIDRFSIRHPYFADDMQLLATVRLTDVNAACRCLERCVTDIQEWCAQRRLQLNSENTELIWFGGRANLERLQAIDITIRLGHVDIQLADCIRDMGILLTSSLSMRQHITRVTSTCFFFIFDGSSSSTAYSTSTPESDLSTL